MIVTNLRKRDISNCISNFFFLFFGDENENSKFFYFPIPPPEALKKRCD